MNNNERLKNLLSQFSKGQVTLQDELCTVLSDSMVFVLLSEPITDSDSGQPTVLKVALRTEDAKQMATLFLNFETGTSWCSRSGIAPNFAEMNGADVCVALPEGTFLRLDPGQPHTAALSPVIVAKTASLGYGTVSKAKMPEAEPAAAPAVASTPEDFQLADPVPPKPRYIPRGHPTTFSMSPVMQKKADEKLNTGRTRTYTSSNLKKIIRPPGSSS